MTPPEQARDSGGLRERIVTALEREPTLDEVRGYGMDGGEGSTFNTLQWRLDLIREAQTTATEYNARAAAQGPEQARDLDPGAGCCTSRVRGCITCGYPDDGPDALPEAEYDR